MNSSRTLFLLAVCFGIALAVQSNDDVVIDFSALSATSYGGNVTALLKLYAINVQTIPQLPIDMTQYSGALYILYITMADKANTTTPVFEDAFGVPSSVFNDQTFLAAEVWNTTTVNSVLQPTFLGGIVLPIAQVKQLPHNNTLILNNQSNLPVGLINVSWQ